MCGGDEQGEPMCTRWILLFSLSFSFLYNGVRDASENAQILLLFVQPVVFSARISMPAADWRLLFLYL